VPVVTASSANNKSTTVGLTKVRCEGIPSAGPLERPKTKSKRNF
jgi:hypothetical protein